jgi:monoamine oxidase
MALARLANEPDAPSVEEIADCGLRIADCRLREGGIPSSPVSPFSPDPQSGTAGRSEVVIGHRPQAGHPQSFTLWSRRQLLAVSASAALAGLGVAHARSSGGTPRIAIVGGGLAGLYAAYRLQRAGYLATIYEGASRIGGRVYTARDLLGPRLTTELGGEFIDSNHLDMLALAKRFGLELLDMQSTGERTLRDAYFFGGRHYRPAQVVEAFRPLAARMEADLTHVGETVSYREHGNARGLDRTSVAEYLHRIGARGWIADLLTVAYVTEYGLDAGEQSALNLLFLIGTDLKRGFKIFGESDERYKVRGGNEQIVRRLAETVEGQLRFDHRLTAIRPRGRGFTLTFERSASVPVDVPADLVLLTLPFTTLREVEIGVELPPVKRRAIQELGYGNSAKLFLGFAERVWRAGGFTGEAFSDEPFQLAWDNSRLQPTSFGGLTLYAGGRAALVLGEGTPDEQAERLMPGVDAVFPGARGKSNGRVDRFHWPSHPFTRAGYACYKPGQWTSIGGAEGEPVGNLHFAGEHCSVDFQGFMNGAAETGRVAADAILAKVK